MQIFLESSNGGVWDVVNGPFIHFITVNDVKEAKPFT